MVSILEIPRATKIKEKLPAPWTHKKTSFEISAFSLAYTVMEKARQFQN